MKINILHDKKTVLPRREIRAEVIFEGKTPSRHEIKEKINAEIKGDKHLLLVTGLKGAFKERKGIVTCLQYDNADAMNEIEYEYRIEKNKIEEMQEDSSSSDEKKDESSEGEKDE